MPIVWSERFVVGIQEIDDQHKRLIRQLNRLEAAVLEGAAEPLIVEVLDFLEAYAAEHFAFEEAVMEQTRCKAGHLNCIAHQAFLRSFKAVRAEYEKNGVTPGLVTKVQTNLLSWAEHHIGGVDCRLRAHTWEPPSDEHAA